MKKTEVLDFDVIFDLLYINILFFFLSKEQLEKITEGMFYFYLLLEQWQKEF